ncbi:OpgC family protein [soil metagenome]
MPKTGRIQSIDFWRGIVLLVIFIDHIPGNPIGPFTPRNFGFSDAAEAFVFLSGLVLAYVNWPRIADGRVGEVVRRCLKRAGELYLVQVSLSLAAVALFGLAFAAGGGDAMLHDDNRAAFFEHPSRGLIGVALLSYQFGYFNILSVYVVLMLMAAGMFLLVARNLLLALVVSVAIYLAARSGLMLPSWPVPYTWFLNPFAWQLLFTLGMIAGSALRAGPVPYSRPLFVAAAGYLVFALLVTKAGFGLLPGLPGKMWPYLDVEKGILGSARLLHFLALAYVVSQIRLGDLLLKVPGSAAVAGLGRQSLSIFAAGSILSAVGQVILAFVQRENANPLAFDLAGVATVFAGVATLVGLARYLTWRQARGVELRPRVPDGLISGSVRGQSSPAS